MQRDQGNRIGRWFQVFVGLGIGAALLGCGGNSASEQQPPAPVVTGDLVIRTLSNRADMISDGDALLEIVMPTGAAQSDLKVTVGDTDVTSSFALRPNGRVMGYLTGLQLGEMTVTATLTSAARRARLTLTNHGRGDAIFSGPQVQPWICATRTETDVIVTVPGTTLSAVARTFASGLDGEPDSKCNSPTKFTYFYQPSTGGLPGCAGIAPPNPCYLPYSPNARPSDSQIADFINDRGDRVKALLRLEEGTMSRGTYQVLAYFDPALPWSQWAPQRGWNGKLFWRMAGNSTANRFQRPVADQHPLVNSTPTGVFEPNALAAGYMVVVAQLTNLGDNNNQLLAAESAMMLKEHIIDTYGEIRFTVSDGPSGGSMNQSVIASAMPGLLQGIIPSISYPDSATTWMETRECGLLGHYYQTADGALLTDSQRAEVEGHPTVGCIDWVARFIQPQDPKVASNCNAWYPFPAREFPASLVYDPVLRPYGVRCSNHDANVNYFGLAIDTDRNMKLRIPYDNVGVQYGLLALRRGAVSPEQFVRLNESVGAYDADMNWSGGSASAPTIPAARFRALPDVFPQIYKSGLVSNGRNLAKVAIIDLRIDHTAGDIHMNWRSMAARARLDAANGGHENHVIRGVRWNSASGTSTGPALMTQSFGMMDRWLTAVESDGSSTALEQKLIQSKPTDVRDGCYNSTGDTDADLSTELSLTDPNCPIAAGLTHTSPRQVAGGPRAEDVFKCQLKPLDALDPEYGGVSFSSAQLTRLRAVFPDGVCDWSKPGVGQTAQWQLLNFESGPSGTVVPPAPTSTPF